MRTCAIAQQCSIVDTRVYDLQTVLCAHSLGPLLTCLLILVLSGKERRKRLLGFEQAVVRIVHHLFGQ